MQTTKTDKSIAIEQTTILNYLENIKKGDTMKRIFKEDEKLYICSMGKVHEISAIFTDDDACNKWLKNNRNHGVIACHDPFVFCANLHSGIRHTIHYSKERTI